ncbi:MAG: SRPBCC domain-containing protein [Acidobacteria bacterium]|nr:SRPBCC domain-containing protein [Acidobacteriota bacterium]
MTVILERKFATDGANLYDAILDPKIASRFVFPERVGEVARAESDARVGGTYTVVEMKDGKEVAHTGEYLELVRPSRIVATFAMPTYGVERSTVGIDIAPAGEGCRLRLTHEGVPEANAEEIKARWEELLESAERVLEE